MSSQTKTGSTVVMALAMTILLANTVAARRSTARVVDGQDTDGCINNITSGIEEVLSAAEQIGVAVIDCGARQTDKCVAAISQTGADIAGAAADVSNAVSACGGRGSVCVTQLLQLSKDLAETGNEVALAADYCTNSTDIIECVADVVDIAATVTKIVESIRGAVNDCKSTSVKEAERLMILKKQH
jgi:hypothetical protein